jgi:O-antigen/teichoic acid export membrane protein
MRKPFDKIPGLSFIGNIVSTSTFRQSGITFFGTFINGILGAGFYIVSARILGPSLFGVLSIAIVTLALVADIGDLGTNTGLTRFVSKYAQDDPEKANRFLRLGLFIKLSVAIFVITIGILLAPFIANKLLTKPELVIPLRISFIGVGTTWLFSFITVALQSFQKFWKWSVIQIFTNFLRLSLVIIFFLVAKVDVNNTLLIYILMPLIGFIVGLTMIPRGFVKAKNEFLLVKEFFQYNKWVAVFIVIAAVGARLDTFISAG